ncbi:hypothetical protein QCA50_001361 [Cerrena zonata]|uniref:Uncharacterized protein n=1 Tax=Cerrena zonata TaxID=2478898 RepID=A0AAW0GN52_9APHY
MSDDKEAMLRHLFYRGLMFILMFAFFAERVAFQGTVERSGLADISGATKSYHLLVASMVIYSICTLPGLYYRLEWLCLPFYIASLVMTIMARSVALSSTQQYGILMEQIISKEPFSAERGRRLTILNEELESSGKWLKAGIIMLGFSTGFSALHLILYVRDKRRGQRSRVSDSEVNLIGDAGSAQRSQNIPLETLSKIVVPSIFILRKDPVKDQEASSRISIEMPPPAYQENEGERVNNYR